MTIHEAAAKGFERGAADYERGRPAYPQAAIDRIVELAQLGPDSVVVDVGAGTGKFTAMLVPSGARLVAVEPVAAMRRALAASVPSAEVREGTAEHLPVGDGEADLVTAAQALHWFDAGAAFAEMARVLRPGGTVALVWNTRDDTWPWKAPLDDILTRVAGDAPRFRPDDDRWKHQLAAEPRLGDLGEAAFANPLTHDLDSMLARISSTSYVSALADEPRAAVLREVTELLQAGPMAEEGPEFVEPYLARLYWCRRL